MSIPITDYGNMTSNHTSSTNEIKAQYEEVVIGNTKIEDSLENQAEHMISNVKEERDQTSHNKEKTLIPEELPDWAKHFLESSLDNILSRSGEDKKSIDNVKALLREHEGEGNTKTLRIQINGKTLKLLNVKSTTEIEKSRNNEKYQSQRNEKSQYDMETKLMMSDYSEIEGEREKQQSFQQGFENYYDSPTVKEEL